MNSRVFLEYIVRVRLLLLGGTHSSLLRRLRSVRTSSRCAMNWRRMSTADRYAAPGVTAPEMTDTVR